MSLTMVKNEEKIIESFIRYNINCFDKMIIIDNGCTDKTMDIVYKLVEEGLPLEIKNESYVDFELLITENKYVYELANKYCADWIIPLDADEFFYVKDKTIFNHLSQDKMYYVHWKNYISLENDDVDDLCVPRRMKHRLEIKEGMEDKEKVVTKVIVSGKLIREEKHIVISAGHHWYIGVEEERIEYLSSAFIGHFPIISKEQLQTKIKGSYVNFIPWMTRGSDGSNLNIRKIQMDEGNFNTDLFAQGGYVVGPENLHLYDVVKEPFHPELVNNIKIKYTSATPIDTEDYYYKQAEIMALKLFNAKAQIGIQKEVPKILVYGTGKSAECLLDRVSMDCVEILAYIDSDRVKQYYKFHHKLIIAPDKIKFYDYDKIVIASVYFKEIKEILLQYHIDEDKIVDSSYLVRLSLGKI